MTALPTRKLEAYRYADIDALASVWTSLDSPARVEIAAQQKLQQIWLPSGEEVDVRRVEMVLEAGAVARIFALNNAARYGRFELDVTMHEGADFAFYGANIGGGDSTLEIVTTLRHVAPGATSHQMIRSVLGDKATGSFLGRIEVAREGQQTDAEQSVKAMLLDRGATANAKPELEIFADDVKCAHGATVGELDKNQLFYAAARGMDPATARALLLEGFVGGLWDEIEGNDQGIAEVARQALRKVAA
ncbi:SufD family Fe-S cluster assembly protein [Sphingomonas sp. NSE70-1]|uniref:SufD family Fe-S cluster assembly protein n=1 Tax=Sphingomonas caseinilyticus TaxID=2908205 RepID=A0ABT0RVH2_9SPHN|nr:SufD family Fe-S cluster assembly protein [Sphingomonas caseinilyticus]MCL6698951.1 SufD family Fe-S cluster assembly protein [Sphingomonas caseinilyticus]